MIRKLFSVLLCAFALLLLMGAGTAPAETAAILAEEESAAPVEQAPAADEEEMPEWVRLLEQSRMSKEENDPAEADGGGEPAVPEEEISLEDSRITVDGVAVPAELSQYCENGVTYVSLAMMARELDPGVQIAWDNDAQQATLTAESLTLTAKLGDPYLVANGRYLYLANGVQSAEGSLIVPLKAVVKAFNASLSWDAATDTVAVTRGSEAIQSGEEYYNEDDLFWLSRIITAESGNQSMEGKMAVGNVVLNRVASDIFPDSVLEVLSQKNQFSPYRNGKLANRTPSEASIIAAKMVLDGGEVECIKGALWFDGSSTSWAAKYQEFAASIGGHNFYRCK